MKSYCVPIKKKKKKHNVIYVIICLLLYYVPIINYNTVLLLKQ